MLEYFECTGLQPADLVKPRVRKKDGKPPAAPRQTKQKHQVGAPAVGNVITNFPAENQMLSQNHGSTVGDQNYNGVLNTVPANGVVLNGHDGGAGDCYGNLGVVAHASALPSFSQIWSNQELSLAQQQQLLAQISLANHHSSYLADAQQCSSLGGVNSDGQPVNGMTYRSENCDRIFVSLF